MVWLASYPLELKGREDEILPSWLQERQESMQLGLILTPTSIVTWRMDWLKSYPLHHSRVKVGVKSLASPRSSTREGIDSNPTLYTIVEGREDESELYPHTLLDCSVEVGSMSWILPKLGLTSMGRMQAEHSSTIKGRTVWGWFIAFILHTLWSEKVGC